MNMNETNEVKVKIMSSFGDMLVILHVPCDEDRNLYVAKVAHQLFSDKVTSFTILEGEDETPDLDTLNLPVKCFNHLMCNGVRTIKKLLQLSEEDLKRIIPKEKYAKVLSAVHSHGGFFPWENIVPGMFVSIWDGGTNIVSPCMVNLETKEVFGVISVDGDVNVNVLDYEEVEVNGERYPVYNAYSDDEEWKEGDFWYA